jgi:hypothetical protein
MARAAYSGRVSPSVNYQLEIFLCDYGDLTHAIRQIDHFAYNVKLDSKKSSLREQISFLSQSSYFHKSGLPKIGALQ